MVEAFKKLKDLSDKLCKEKKFKNHHVYLEQFQKIKVRKPIFQQDSNNLEPWKTFYLAQQNFKLIEMEKLQMQKNAIGVT